jgi:hypothetical protein
MDRGDLKQYRSVKENFLSLANEIMLNPAPHARPIRTYPNSIGRRSGKAAFYPAGETYQTSSIGFQLSGGPARSLSADTRLTQKVPKW